MITGKSLSKNVDNRSCVPNLRNIEDLHGKRKEFGASEELKQVLHTTGIIYEKEIVKN